MHASHSLLTLLRRTAINWSSIRHTTDDQLNINVINDHSRPHVADDNRVSFSGDRTTFTEWILPLELALETLPKVSSQTLKNASLFS